MEKIIFLLLSLMCIGLDACGRKTIHGEVEDVFGKPVAEVNVAVEHSGFTSTTNSAGAYALDYAAGNFVLVFAKPGYTTMRQAFSIKERIEYPVATMVLTPIPSTPGIWWIGPEKLVRISTGAPIQTAKESQPVASGLPRIRYFTLPDHETPRLTKAATLRFVDTLEEFMSLAKLDDAGTIGHATLPLAGVMTKFECTSCLKDQPSLIGDEKLLVRSAKLSPGWYVWLPLEHVPHADSEQHVPLIPKETCYPFLLN